VEARNLKGVDKEITEEGNLNGGELSGLAKVIVMKDLGK